MVDTIIPDIREIITDIQSLGVRVPFVIDGRKGGAGPAEGRALMIENIPVNAPIHSHYVKDSPYTLQPSGHRFLLVKKGKELLQVDVVPPPRFYEQTTRDGISYKQIALLHGKDCLATTVIQTCAHWKTGRRCKFCGTEISLRNGMTMAKKTPEHLIQVAKAACESDGISHIVLTSGTGDPAGTEIRYLAECARAVKAATDLPIHLQCAPPEDIGLLDELKRAGADTLGIHIESFDPDTLDRIAPAKAAIGLNRYEQAWKRAVRLFGPGQVSSFLIVGLGEDPGSVVRGSEILADLGVYPFVVPLRPIPGSLMHEVRPPAPELMKKIYTAVAKILRQKGLRSRDTLAGCVRCGACSALHAYEDESRGLICHRVRTEQEQAAVYAIRNAVFVREQGLFRDSDKDEQDEYAIHLILKEEDDIVGTVRVFPDKAAKSHWIGGRLAVRKDKRSFRAAARLVKEAMKQVKKNGCILFTAHIQMKNVPFFKKLGWTSIGPAKEYLKQPHQVMAADLSRISEDF